MNDMSIKYWQERSNKFFVAWLLFLGGISVIGYGINSGIELVHQVSKTLSQYNSQSLILESFRLSFIREFFPVNLGLTFAWLIPPLGVVALYMLEKSELSQAENKEILIKTIRYSILLAVPAFLVLGLTTSLTTAFFTAENGKLSSLFNLKDYIEMLAKSILFISTVYAFSFVATKFVNPMQNLGKRIAFCFCHVLLASLAILLIDYGVSYLLVTI
jgi:hypothetical protein